MERVPRTNGPGCPFQGLRSDYSGRKWAKTTAWVGFGIGVVTALSLWPDLLSVGIYAASFLWLFGVGAFGASARRVRFLRTPLPQDRSVKVLDRRG
jgi:hypothetical protein